LPGRDAPGYRPAVNRQRVLTASRAEAAQLAGQRLSEVVPSRRDFARYVDTQKQDLAVIARLGTRPEWTRARLVAHAQACDDAEVAALAVATGALGGLLDDLAAVADSTTAAILRDDLLVDSRQLYDARLHGADAARPVGESAPAQPRYRALRRHTALLNLNGSALL